jgi:CRISPR type III-A-associated protein Csm2
VKEMARQEQEERENRAQELVEKIVNERLRGISQLSQLQLTEDLVREDGDLSQLAKAFVRVRSEREKLKPTQLRRVFHDLKRLEQRVRRGDSIDVRTEVMLILPMLAYALGREVIPRPFYELMKTLLDRVREQEDLQRLTEFLTVLLAYHKFHDKVKESTQGGEA